MVDRNGSRDFYGFDYTALSNEKPDPGELPGEVPPVVPGVPDVELESRQWRLACHANQASEALHNRDHAA